MSSKPRDRRGFGVAIICALTLEAEMVEMIFDERYDTYGKAAGDSNTYTTGSIAGHNVVLAYLPGMGNTSAAQVASSLKTSFRGIKIAFVVGITGAMPMHDKEEIVLGDCLISTAVIQYDFGRKGPTGFKRKDGQDALGRANSDIRGFLMKLQTQQNKVRLQQSLVSHLERLSPGYPGIEYDRLFPSDHAHQHEGICEQCQPDLGICGKDCEELGCTGSVQRGHAVPTVHFGCFGSASTVLKSGLDRDQLAQDGIIAFEMEAAGVWDVFPTIVVKSSCDYADSHKNKIWQKYAAAVAAAGVKSVIQQLDMVDEDEASSLQPVQETKTCFHVPDILSPYYTGRKEELVKLKELYAASITNGPSRCIVYGMPGLGKTQFALQFAYSSRSEYPSVFWVHGASVEKIDSGFSDLLEIVGIQAADQRARNLAAKQWLENARKWLLILDNINEETMHYLKDLLPVSNSTGHILITTRFEHVASSLSFAHNERHTAMELPDFKQSDAIELFFATRNEDVTSLSASDEREAALIIKKIGYLPLAVDQAASLSISPGQSIWKVLEIYESPELKDAMEWGSTTNRHEDSSVLACFKALLLQVQQTSSQAYDLLKVLAFLDSEGIPMEMLRQGLKELSQDKFRGCDTQEPLMRLVSSFRTLLGPQRLVNVLTKLSIVKFKNDGQSIWIHDLVQLLIRENLMNEDEQNTWLDIATNIVVKAFSLLGDSSEPKYWKETAIFVSQVQALRVHSDQRGKCNGTLMYTEGRIAIYLNWTGNGEAARKINLRHLEISLSTYGPKHLCTIRDMINLAMIASQLGDVKEGEAMACAALAAAKEAPGVSPWDLMDCLEHIIVIYINMGDWVKAEAMFERHMKLLTEMPDGPWQMIPSTFLLVRVYANQGNLQKAKILLLQLLPKIRSNGWKYPYRTLYIDSLAFLYIKEGKIYQAMAVLDLLALLNIRQLGAEHPETLSCKWQAVQYRSCFDSLDQSIGDMELLLAKYIKIHGPNHPKTRTMVQTMAEILNCEV